RLRELSFAFDELKPQRATAARRDLQRELSRGLALRDVIARNLASVVKPDTDLRKQLSAAAGTVDPPSSLTRSLRALAAVSESLRAGASASFRASLAALGISDSVIAQLRSAADVIDEKSGLVDGTIGGRNAQRELDYQDGIVLALLTLIYRAFEYANAQS